MHGILSRVRRRLIPLAIFAVVATAYGFGTFAPIELALMDSRFRLLPRGVTGKVAVVAIDSRSLHALDTWPWPRNYYAKILDRLIAAGAKKIAFDIDLSSTSTPSGDHAFAASLARADGRVILPVFAQRNGLSFQNRNAVYNTLPLLMFRRSALLGGVNVFPSADGLVRQYSPVIMLDKAPMPSLAAMLYGRVPARQGSFYLDYGIHIRNIPVLSFIDVLNEKFNPAVVSGRDVIVGATAVQLGDELTVPLHRTLPGPLLQALAFECLAQGRTLHRSGWLPTLALAFFILIALERQLSGRGWRRGLFVLSGAGVVLYGSALAIQAVTPFSLDLAPALATITALYLIGILREVEEHAQAALKHRASDLQRRAMMQCVLQDSFDGIVITDAAGKIEMVNSAGCKMLGLRPEGMVGKLIDLILPGSASLHADALAARHADPDQPLPQSTPVELRFTGPDQATKTIEHLASCSLLHVTRRRKERGTPDHHVFIHTFRDISERKTAETKLRDAMQQALAANQTKTEFLANMSHELRTPLNAIIGFSEIIRDSLFEPVAERYRTYATDINNSGQRLLSVINDVLDIAKIETGNFEINDGDVDLAGVVAACRPIIDEQAKKSNIDLKMSLAPNLPLILGDPARLKQIILNLLSNAVKFTSEGGRVELSAALVEDGSLELRISDTGIGMKPEDVSSALEPFRQVESTFNRVYEGTGLGLSLALSLTRLHGGTLDIDSELGRGTTVRVRLPAARILSDKAALPKRTGSRHPSAAA